MILSGCGHKDGSEITEAVSTLISISSMGARYEVFAPNMKFHVRDPITAQPTNESRNLMLEAARISRGKIRDLSELKAREFDALALPGGFGVALHLCNFAEKGASCTVHPEVERALIEFFDSERPIAAICIAPALVARVLGSKGITVTIGKDAETAAEIEKTGAIHEPCAVDDFVTDREHRIVTTPAYMYGNAEPSLVFTGIKKAISELVEMA